jgi:hypothetical protein
VLSGNWEVVLLVDEHSSPEQRDALVKVFSGQLGGPLADFAQLIGTVKGIESAPISHQVQGGTGTRRIPGVVEAEMEPYRGPTAASPPCRAPCSRPSRDRRPGSPRPA